MTKKIHIYNTRNHETALLLAHDDGTAKQIGGRYHMFPHRIGFVMVQAVRKVRGEAGPTCGSAGYDGDMELRWEFAE
jgi:hypothetical protein